MKKLNNEVYKIDEISDFRDMINQSVKKYSNNIAYKFKVNLGKSNERIVEKTYQEVKSEVQCLGTMLLNMGLENKKIAIIGSNRYEWCESYFAITTSNMVAVPLDKALPEAEIESLIERSKVDAVIYENKYNEVFENIKNTKESTIKYYINMDLKEDKNEILSFKKLIEKGKELIKNGDTKYNNVKVDNKKMTVLIFTSGTTNTAKGVMLSQKNITSNIMAMAKMSKMYSDDVLLSFLPLHHTFECTITFLYGFYSGVTVAFCDGLKYIAKNLQEYEISVFVAVPLVLETIYKKIQKGIKDQGKEKLVNLMSKIANFLLIFHIDIRRKLFSSILKQLGGKLRIAYFGAAAMDKNVIKGYNNFGIDTVQGYGLTETSPLVAAETDKEHCPGGVGMAPYNVKIRLENVNEKGVGEIVTTGPNVMLGYYENEEATKNVIKDGWFNTGDLGYFDKNGYLFITGRKKEVIVLKNGENVYPTDIEFLVNKLPYVQESILFPRENSKGEIALGIKIVYDKDLIKEYFQDKKQSEYHDLIWEDIKEINQNLSQFKRIKELIITKEPLEKTTTQKVKRFKEIEKILENINE
ncbi:MAG: AMP-binding protein [Clostridia bacterium]|nr:AMP-binding protein [Clostridia bacterium]